MRIDHIVSIVNIVLLFSDSWTTNFVIAGPLIPWNNPCNDHNRHNINKQFPFANPIRDIDANNILNINKISHDKKSLNIPIVVVVLVLVCCSLLQLL